MTQHTDHPLSDAARRDHVLTLEVHHAILQGDLEETPEADARDEEMTDVWIEMSIAERDDIRILTAELHKAGRALGNGEIGWR